MTENYMPQDTKPQITDEHLGAVEGDRPNDHPQQGNPHGGGVDEQGLPDDPVATCEDALGANTDKSQG